MSEFDDYRSSAERWFAKCGELEIAIQKAEEDALNQHDLWLKEKDSNLNNVGIYSERVRELQLHLANTILAAEAFLPNHPVVLKAKEALANSEPESGNE
jgi:hypothetical protein